MKIETYIFGINFAFFALVGVINPDRGAARGLPVRP